MAMLSSTNIRPMDEFGEYVICPMLQESKCPMSFSFNNPMSPGVYWVCAAVFLGALCVNDCTNYLLIFENWSEEDIGSHLTLSDLLSEGRLPNVDFTYLYGLLSVLVNEWWGGLFGNSCTSFATLVFGAKIIQTLVMIILGRQIKMPWPGEVCFLAGVFWFSPIAHSISHLGERTALMLAIYAGASRGPRMALLSATFAVLFRPALGFLVGLAVLVWIFKEAWDARHRTSLLREFAVYLWPSLATLIFVLGAYWIRFGWASLSQTLFPFAGMNSYQSMQHSFATNGLTSIILPNHNWRWYVTNPAIPFMMSVLMSCALAPLAVWKFARKILVTGSASPGLVISVMSSSIALASLIFVYGGNTALTYYRPFFWIAALSSFSLITCRFRGLANALAIVTAAYYGICLGANTILSFRGLQDREYLPKLVLFIKRDAKFELERFQETIGDSEVSFVSQMGCAQPIRTLGLRVTSFPYWNLQPGLNGDKQMGDIRGSIFSREFAIFRANSPYYLEGQLCLTSTNSKRIWSGVHYNLYKLHRDSVHRSKSH